MPFWTVHSFRRRCENRPSREDVFLQTSDRFTTTKNVFATVNVSLCVGQLQFVQLATFAEGNRNMELRFHMTLQKAEFPTASVTTFGEIHFGKILTVFSYLAKC